MYSFIILRIFLRICVNKSFVVIFRYFNSKTSLKTLVRLGNLYIHIYTYPYICNFSIILTLFILKLIPVNFAETFFLFLSKLIWSSKLPWELYPVLWLWLGSLTTSIDHKRGNFPFLSARFCFSPTFFYVPFPLLAQFYFFVLIIKKGKKKKTHKEWKLLLININFTFRMFQIHLSN